MYRSKYDNDNISAEIIADSISPDGVRLTTMICVFHRFILAEINTHRSFSRNSASSRAIPISKLVDQVKNNPAIPVFWGKNQAGMQAMEELSNEEKAIALSTWLDTRDSVVGYVDALCDEVHLHKQLTNRLLEPFMWHTAIITATEWNNFFAQRCSIYAQPEILALANKMQDAYYESIPKQLNLNEWHLPFILEEDKELDIDILRKLSVARCARVSYLSHNGKREIEKDIDLYNKLIEGMHWSPFEHIAIPINKEEQSGNFKGWKQFRKTFNAENQEKFERNIWEQEI